LTKTVGVRGVCIKIRNSKRIADSAGERGGDIVSDKERAPSYVLGVTMKSTCPLLPELASWEPCCFMVFDQIEIAIGAATAVEISCRLLFMLYNL